MQIRLQHLLLTTLLLTSLFWAEAVGTSAQDSEVKRPTVSLYDIDKVLAQIVVDDKAGTYAGEPEDQLVSWMRKELREKGVKPSVAPHDRGAWPPRASDWRKWDEVRRGSYFWGLIIGFKAAEYVIRDMSPVRDYTVEEDMEYQLAYLDTVSGWDRDPKTYVQEVDRYLAKVKNEYFLWISITFFAVEKEHSKQDGNEWRMKGLELKRKDAHDRAWIQKDIPEAAFDKPDFWQELMKRGTAEFYAMGFLDAVRLTRTRVKCNVVGIRILIRPGTRFGALREEMERQLVTAPADATLLRMWLSASRALYATTEPGKRP